MNGEAGKGDTYRRVDWKKWDEGWERAFGKRKTNDKATDNLDVRSSDSVERRVSSKSPASRLSRPVRKSTPVSKRAG